MISATVVGHLGRDAEIRQAGDSSILSFSIASTTRKKVGGVWEKGTTWVSVSMFGERGVKLQSFLTKGKVVAVTGELTLREYESGGQQRTSLDCKASEIEMFGGNGGADDGAGEPKASGGQRRPGTTSTKQYAPPVQQEADDSLPF
jgi:single-strand DNA-binding protein